MVSEISTIASTTALPPPSYHEVGQKTSAASAGHRNGNSVFQEVLPQERLLRNGPIRCHSSMHIRRSKGRGVVCTHQERYFRVKISIQSNIWH